MKNKNQELQDSRGVWVSRFLKPVLRELAARTASSKRSRGQGLRPKGLEASQFRARDDVSGLPLVVMLIPDEP